jgi:glycine hydroxymethyltransferase
MTSRGLTEADFQQIADLLHEALEICQEVQAAKGKLLKDFVVGLEQHPKVVALRAKVEAFASKFPMPGFSVADLE